MSSKVIIFPRKKRNNDATLSISIGANGKQITEIIGADSNTKILDLVKAVRATRQEINDRIK